MSRSLIRKNQLHPDISDLVGQYGSGYFISNQSVVYTTGNQIISGKTTLSGNVTPLVVIGHTLINHNGGPAYNTIESLEVYESGNYGTYAKINNPNTGINSRAGIYLASPGNNVYAFTTPNTLGYRFHLSGDAFTNFQVQNTGTQRVLISGNRILIGGITGQSDGAVLQVPDGITFQSGVSTSNNKNTLDYYEEGVWTPYYCLDTDTTNQNYYIYNNTLTNGSYTRIGNLVHIRGKIFATGTGSNPIVITSNFLNSGVAIGGLPFIVLNLNNANQSEAGDFNVPYWQFYSPNTAINIGAWGRQGRNNLYITRTQSATVNTPRLTHAGLVGTSNTGLYLIFGGTYQTPSPNNILT